MKNIFLTLVMFLLADQSKLPNYVPTIQANETVGLPPRLGGACG